MTENTVCKDIDPSLILPVEPDMLKSPNVKKFGKKGRNETPQEREDREKRDQIVLTAKNTLKSAKATVMQSIAKYTHKNRDVKTMSAQESLDYSAFLFNQQDVHATEKAREAYETTKNIKQVRTLKQAVKVISTVMVGALLIAMVALAMFAVIYLFVYLKKDKLKSFVNIMMLGSAVAFILIFAVYVMLFSKILETIKKIMFLL